MSWHLTILAARHVNPGHDKVTGLGIWSVKRVDCRDMLNMLNAMRW